MLAHQHLGQLPRDIAEAAYANARNKIYFCCSPEDARVLARHSKPYLKAYDLCHLDAHQVARRLVVAGKDLHAFTLRTRPLPPAGAGRADQARKYARENAGRSRLQRRQEQLARRRRHRRGAGGGPGGVSPGVSPGGPAGVPDTPEGAPKNVQHRPPPLSASQDPDSWDHL